MIYNKIRFSKAQYLVGEDIVLSLRLKINPNSIKTSVYDREVLLDTKIKTNTIQNYDGVEYNMMFSLPRGNYIVKIVADSMEYYGAIDVVSHAGEIVRYAFLADFEGLDDCTDVESLADKHFNCIQFYDWMYRHDKLVSEEETYTEPLGRKVSLSALRKKIDACKQKGIRPFAYGAVYVATKETFHIHNEWAMYNSVGKALTFADWLWYMNVSEECKWSNHIIGQYVQSVKQLGFVGIHMDTYGFPKVAYDCNGKEINLANQFVSLINRADRELKKLNPSNGVIFNAVNNWPIKEVAASNQDSGYIEVWKPFDKYYDLYSLINFAKYNGCKNVILAAYMLPFKNINNPESLSKAEYSYLLANAAICSSGGTQLALGENKGILSNSYYVDYATISDNFDLTTQKYCDYLVAYASTLYNDKGEDVSRTFSDGINEDIIFESAKIKFSSSAEGDSVWTIIRKSEHLLTINLINLVGNDNEWNTPKNKPKPIYGINIKLRMDKHYKSVWYATPDREQLTPTQLIVKEEESKSGLISSFILPQLFVWTTVYLILE